MNMISTIPFVPLSTIGALSLMTCVVSAQALPSPVARWDLNGTGADAIGLSPATVNNVQWASDTILGTERQVAYLGAGGRISVAKTSALDLHATGFTLMGWVKSPNLSIVPGPNTFFTIIESQGVTGVIGPAYLLRYNASSIHFQFSTEQNGNYRDMKFFRTDEWTTDLMQSNQWNHVAVSYDGQTFRAFINGLVLSNSGGNVTLDSGSSYVSQRQTGIGGFSDGATGGYDPAPNGYIADVRIYDAALSTSNIEQIATVPEPSTYALLLLSGAASLYALKRRKS
jgi:hypothetical protein